jgi:hypothetical protein
MESVCEVGTGFNAYAMKRRRRRNRRSRRRRKIRT